MEGKEPTKEKVNKKTCSRSCYKSCSPLKIDEIRAKAVSYTHLIKEFLESLPKWDGINRVEKLLIDYFAAADNSYTRAVIRKTMVAAVARIYLSLIHICILDWNFSLSRFHKYYC